MADKDDTTGSDKERGESKEFEVEGSVEGQATVTELTEKQKEKEAEAAGTCIECGTPLFEGRCINADCSIAQAQASRGAGRATAKASAGAAAPRAVTRSGRVD